MAKRVLIITYHFPPINLIASRRFGEMAPLMKEQGWEPFVLTTKSKGDLPVLIPEKNIVRIGEHCDSKKKIVKEEGFKGIPFYLRPIYFLYRKFDIRIKSIDRFVFSWRREVLNNMDVIKKINPDVIIATTSPIVCLWLGRGIAKRLGRPWIADFRDACSLFNPSSFPLVKFLDEKIDKHILKTASLITSYGSYIGNQMRNFYNKETHIIFNGFKKEKLKNLDYVKKPSKKKTVYYAGRFHSHRVPAVKMLIDWMADKKDIYLKIRSLGPEKANKEILEKVKENNLESRVELLNPATEEQVMKEEREADFLAIFGDLNTEKEIYKGSMPGKLFEYLPYKGIILAVVRADSDVQTVLRETNRGEVVSSLGDLDSFFSKEQPRPNIENLKKYTREFQVQKLCKLFDRVKG